MYTFEDAKDVMFPFSIILNKKLFFKFFFNPNCMLSKRYSNKRL